MREKCPIHLCDLVGEGTALTCPLCMASMRAAFARPSLTAAMENTMAWRLGEAAREAMAPEHPVGDPIDRGLILLRILNEKGFDVVARGTT